LAQEILQKNPFHFSQAGKFAKPEEFTKPGDVFD
jgi:hypothetical protein